MIDNKDFPILEFDTSRDAVLEPQNFIKKLDISPYCVITFFREVIENKRADGLLTHVATICSETVDLPIYETEYEGKKVCLVLGFLGSAGAAAQLEELIAHGCNKFIVCGGAGVLQKNIALGHLIVPISAVRDEGVSYHYIAPSREVECDGDALKVIETELLNDNLPYIKAKTWTTDAFYRETRDKVNLRALEGCVSVEMEAAAFFAVSKFRGVKLGQILYAGDDLSGETWDGREWNSRSNIRKNLVEFSMKACLKL